MTKLRFLKGILSLFAFVFLILFHSYLLADKFYFIHLTDSHVGYQPGTLKMQEAIKEIRELKDKPAFIINTGDLTERGTEQEYQTYKDMISALNLSVYNVPGNHEVRWADMGKERFRKFFGEPYYSFDYGSFHFIGLDTSIPLEHHGIFDPAQLEWLEANLAKISKDTPICLFSHHPPCFPDSQFLTGDQELLKILKDYNVKLFLTGHGHSNRIWVANSIVFVMTRALYAQDGGYRIISVEDETIKIYYKPLGAPIPPETNPEITLTIEKSVPPKLQILKPKQGSYIGNLLEIVVSHTGRGKVSYQIDETGKWYDLTPAGTNLWTGSLANNTLAPGKHFLTIRATADSKEVWYDYISFHIRGARTKELWHFDAKSAIQGSPVFSNGLVYFGAWNGTFYALDAHTGEKKWEFKTPKPIISTPAISDNLVYFGSTDANIYALDTASGTEIWRFTTDGPIQATPLVANETIYIGSGDNSFYALNKNSGKLLWRYQTGALIQARPLKHQDTIYFGAWDNYFYALEASTGTEKWKKSIGRSMYFSPAASSPALLQDKIIFATPENLVYFLDAKTGELKTTYKAQSGYSSPLISGDKIFFGSMDGKVYALSSEGKLLWERKLGTPFYDSSATISDNTLYITDLKGQLYTLEADMGTLLATYKTGKGYVFSTPATTQGIVYVTSMDGNLYAISLGPVNLSARQSVELSTRHLLGSSQGRIGSPKL